MRLVNLFEVLDPQDRFRKMTGSAPEDWYNKRLARGWTIGMAQELKILQGLIRLGHTSLVKTLQQHWLQTEPDLVVSLVPNFNRAMFESLASTLPGVPYVTVLTDLADIPPHFWIERGQPQHFICGSARATAQALELGHAPERVHATSGMIIRPEFYEAPALDRAGEMRRLGLDPARPTALVLFGGHGSKAMLGIAKRLGASTQLILVCGHNKALAAQLRALPRRCAAAGGRFCVRHPALHAAGRLLHRQTRAGQHQRSGAARPAGDRGRQRLDHAAGALQRAVDHRAPPGHRAPKLSHHRPRGGRACSPGWTSSAPACGP